ncbi:MAG TPA: hypothetical protein VFA04_20925 [Bryobacteraceae bacterium]|nr:hypothetical protein [Bryobacteraceae bacterium]
MNNPQLFFAIGIPTLAILVGILVNMIQVSTINARITDVVSRLSALEDRVNTGFDLLTKKIYELDTRISRIEERLNFRS